MSCKPPPHPSVWEHNPPIWKQIVCRAISFIYDILCRPDEPKKGPGG
ncbi:hypothetical protein ES703_100948 [subsurface metagenome]